MAVAKVFIRTAYNYDIAEASNETAIAIEDTPENHRTKQSFAEECDINVIVDRFMKTGQMPQNIQLPRYEDYDGIMSFQDAMNTIIAAEEEFLKMPAQTRAKFHNDPQEFLEFVSDPDNKAEMKKMGLLADIPEVISAAESPGTGTPPSASAVPPTTAVK